LYRLYRAVEAPCAGHDLEIEMRDDAVAPDDQSSTVERRLATILMVNVFGYGRMMGEDEERTCGLSAAIVRFSRTS